MRQPGVGVMGSGRDPHDDLAAPLGRWIAERGFHLLTGGGGGVMEAVSRAFVSVEERRGLAIGVVPGRVEGGEYSSPSGYPNDCIDLPILTHLPSRGDPLRDEREAIAMSRNPINVLSSTIVVALPGSGGTRSEVELALQYGRPVIAFLGESGEIVGLDTDRVAVARTLDEVERFVDTTLES